jgi:hypothetical protein
LEQWLEDGLAKGGRRRTSDAVAGGLGEEQRRLLIDVGCSGGRGEWRGEQRRGVSGRRRKEELFGGALLLKQHEAVAEGYVAAGTVGGNGGRSRVRGQGGGYCCPKALSTVGRLCSDREADRWAPRYFDFFLFIQNGLNIKKSKMVSYVS